MHGWVNVLRVVFRPEVMQRRASLQGWLRRASTALLAIAVIADGREDGICRRRLRFSRTSAVEALANLISEGRDAHEQTKCGVWPNRPCNVHVRQMRK